MTKLPIKHPAGFNDHPVLYLIYIFKESIFKLPDSLNDLFIAPPKTQHCKTSILHFSKNCETIHYR